MSEQQDLRRKWTRREFVGCSLAGAALGLAGFWAWRQWVPAGLSLRGILRPGRAATFVARAPSYEMNLAGQILEGLAELGVTAQEVKGKKILLKPNLVETREGAQHITTHPAVVRGAAEAFRHLGASQVVVGEGVGHLRDSLLVLEESGLAEVLWQERIPFIDLNFDEVFRLPNAGGFSRLSALTLPATLKRVDWVVSLAKMKTHHWAGVTLSMKNLFGLMPGSYYGWPKNVLHHAGIPEAILDINLSVRPHFAIVDGIVGMEGDGPIMGTPKPLGVLVMGRNLPAVDATGARLMGINPYRIRYLAAAAGRLGPIAEAHIEQRGEAVAPLRRDFLLLEEIPAHQGLRLS